MTHHVPAQGRIRRRSSALFSTALTCGQTSVRACSSSLTTSLNLHRSAGTGFGGRVRHGLRAPGSNASRLIVGLVSPHREQRPGQAPCERYHGHLLATPPGDRLRPRAEGFRPRIFGARQAPSGLHEQGLQMRMCAPHDSASALFLTGAVLVRYQPVGLELLILAPNRRFDNVA